MRKTMLGVAAAAALLAFMVPGLAGAKPAARVSATLECPIFTVVTDDPQAGFTAGRYRRLNFAEGATPLTCDETFHVIRSYLYSPRDHQGWTVGPLTGSLAGKNGKRFLKTGANQVGFDFWNDAKPTTPPSSIRKRFTVRRGTREYVVALNPHRTVKRISATLSTNGGRVRGNVTLVGQGYERTSNTLDYQVKVRARSVVRGTTLTIAYSYSGLTSSAGAEPTAKASATLECPIFTVVRDDPLAGFTAGRYRRLNFAEGATPLTCDETFHVIRSYLYSPRDHQGWTVGPLTGSLAGKNGKRFLKTGANQVGFDFWNDARPGRRSTRPVRTRFTVQAGRRRYVDKLSRGRRVASIRFALSTNGGPLRGDVVVSGHGYAGGTAYFVNVDARELVHGTVLTVTVRYAA